MSVERILFYFACLGNFIILHTEQCLQVGNGNGLPSFTDYGGGEGQISRYHQAIIPSYQFQCCGNVTEWRIDVHPGGGKDNKEYTLNLQVWRPSPTVDLLSSGSYNLIGNNRFTSVSLRDGAAQVTPSPQEYIRFRPGDVLGFYVEEAKDDNRGVVVLTTNSYTHEIVWHAGISNHQSQILGCPVSVGSSGTLNTILRGAPVIEIDSSTYDCPRIVPTPPPCPTLATRTTSSIHTMLVSFSSNPTSSSEAIPDSTRLHSPSHSPSNLILPDSTSTISASPESLEVLLITATPVETYITPTRSVNSNDNDHTLRRSGDQSGLVVVVLVLAVVLLILLVTIITGLAIALSRKRNKLSAYTKMLTSQRSVGRDGEMNNPVYDYAESDDNHMRVDFNCREYNNHRRTISDLSNVDDKTEVLYHSVGPSTCQDTGASSLRSETKAHIDEADMRAHCSIANSAAESEECHYEMESGKTYNKLEFFQDSLYWDPASTAVSDLYSQLALKEYREIPRHEVSIQEKIGLGQFGVVCKAVWSISGATKELAIKTLRAELPEDEKVRFLQEAAIMGQFSHPNVVKLYGVVTVGDPIMICIELMSHGDLSGYLCSLTPNLDKENVMEEKRQFLRFSKQIALGMDYLSKKSFIHRDLAARNILLDDALNCKIGDFGMARDLMYETYYTPKSKIGKIPVKWTAPEALHYQKYSTDSDVWSYGMVLFEIWSVGKKPFLELSNKEVVNLINTGYNQPPPPGCPRAIYKLMVDCWHPVHSERPSFSKICSYFKAPNEQLLQWVDEAVTSQRARMLGASLSEAESLYLDLQNFYKNYH